MSDTKRAFVSLSGGEASSSLTFVASVMNAGSLSVGGDAGSPGVLPGGRKRNRNCPAGPQPFL